MAADSFTPNLHLRKIAANRMNWTDSLNNNFTMLDALVSAFFVVNNLKGSWENATVYAVDDTVVDSTTAVIWKCVVAHTSSSIPTTFLEDRTSHPTYWITYSASATARGVWLPDTDYNLNDFVVSGQKYAVCVAAHTSDADFDKDVDSGYWSILVDGTTIGTGTLPTPGGSGDANKFAVVDSSGSGYTIIASTQVLTLLGATSLGIALLQANSASSVRSTLDAQEQSPELDNIAALSTTSFGRALLTLADAAALRSTAALGTMATETASVYAKLASPTFTGSPKAVTKSIGDNSTNIATTAYVDRQVGQEVYTSVTTMATGTTAFPIDDTIPQITEGDEYATLAITPKSATSKLVIDVSISVSSSGADNPIVALFQDSTANALAASITNIYAAGAVEKVWLRHEMTSGTISATTFRVRVGTTAARTITINGSAGGRLLGGALATIIRIREIL